MAEKVLMPKLGFDMAEGVLVRWIKMQGDAVAKGDVLAEIETDKATVEVESQLDGQLLQHLVPQNAVVPVGAPIALMGQPGEVVENRASDVEPKVSGVEKVPEKKLSETKKDISGSYTTNSERIKVSPLAKKMAEAGSLSLKGVQGSGPGGRIVKADIEKRLAQQTKPPLVSAAISSGNSLPDVKPMDKKVPVSKLRQIIGRRMVDSKQLVPHFYVSRDYEVDALIQMRTDLNQLLPPEEKLSVNDFIVKATGLTLSEFPNLNAAILDQEIVQFGQINIGNAVAVEGGLMTVVLKDVPMKSIRTLSMESKALVQRAREGKVKTEDIEGSTFSISNLGMYKIDHFSAIINPPEAAILAVGAAQQVPVVKDNALTIGWKMNLTLSADHRITDGAEAAEFLLRMEYYLQNPLLLLV